MNWIIFSLLSAFIWATVNIVDKYILTNWIKKPTIPAMITGTVGLIASFLIYLFRGFDEISYQLILVAFSSGCAYALATILYFKAAKEEEISRIVPLFHLAPLFILILAAIFLGEIFTPITYVGITLLVIGAISISYKNNHKFGVNKASIIMCLSVLCFSIDLVIMKYLLGFADFWTIFSYIRIGVFLALIPIFYLHRKDLFAMVRLHGKKPIGALFINESLNLFGKFCFTIAASYGYITLVESLTSIQSLVVFLYALGLSIFYPKILNEEMNKSAITVKIMAIIFMITGSILII